jgi:hypothetical protein
MSTAVKMTRQGRSRNTEASTNFPVGQKKAIATLDVTALQKLARTFDVMMEDLIEVVEE